MSKRVVITGMGCVSPNGIGNEAFCRAILAGKSGVKRVKRFDPSDLPVQIAGEIDDFDESKWIDAKERKHVGRVVPLAVAAGTEALQDSGVDFAAMDMEAKRQVQAGVLPMILTGGVDAPIAPGIMKGFTLMKIMTSAWNNEPHRASRPFSKDRDGFVVAEGAWMFVLEDYDRAKARGAKIYAEIAGYGSTCEAFHRVRLEECGEEPARAIGLAMKEAGIAASDVQYANLHGTSTQLNDRIETRAMKLALGNHAYKVPMSSLKSQIGHPQGACGAAGVASTLVAMKHSEIAPTINVDIADPDCDLDYVPMMNHGSPYSPRRAAIEHAVCNCIAFGSKNSAMVLRKV